MNTKTFKLIKKVMAMLVIVMLLGTTITSAASGSTSVITSLKTSSNNIKQFKSFLKELNTDIQEMSSTTQNVDTLKASILDKIEELENEYNNGGTTYIADQLTYQVLTSDATSSSSLITSLTSSIKSFLGNTSLANSSLKPDEEIYIQAKTAENITEESKYNVKLHGNIYYSETNSDKWILLIHPTSMSGQSITNVLGEMYLDQGYNIIAPDLRGFGDSEGSVAMGYLESLDMWDWLTYLNDNYNVSEVIAHGISLGGATTIFLSGLTVDNETLKDQNVIGVIEDCGYTTMVGMVRSVVNSVADNKLAEIILGLVGKGSLEDLVTDEKIKDYLLNEIDVGMTEENIDTLQNGQNSLVNCEVPVLIMHGTKDTIVPYENSDLAFEALTSDDAKTPYVQRCVAEGQAHAFIVIGMHKTEYQGQVNKFLKKAETIAQNGGTNSGDKISTETLSSTETGTETSTNVITKAWSLIKSIFNR